VPALRDSVRRAARRDARSAQARAAAGRSDV
jgi:hypothetical protein